MIVIKIADGGKQGGGRGAREYMTVYLLLPYKIWREEVDFKSCAPSQLFFSFFLFDLENWKLF
jgi:hypothetical protein